MPVLLKLGRYGCCSHFIRKRFYRAGASSYGHKEDGSGNRLDEQLDVVPRFDGDCRLQRLVDAFRKWGHRAALLDPLLLPESESEKRKLPTELQYDQYGFSQRDLATSFTTNNLLFGRIPAALTLSNILTYLEERYCGHVAAEFDYLESADERTWFAKTFEELDSIVFSTEDQKDLAQRLLKFQNFDHFLASKFATVKRYGGEGAEAMAAFFHELFSQSPSHGLREIVLCMPHRGRLNLLSTMLHYPATVMFQKMKGKCEFPSGVKGLGDVLSHLSTSVDLNYATGKVHVTMIPNPSHLEANNPVAVGKVRGRMQSLELGDYSPLNSASSRQGDGVLCVQVHGDASIVGQGIVPETLAISAAPHFRVGGSLHLVVNNQIGFTTEATYGRSTAYCTDVAKMVLAPVLHVNGNHPELVAKVTRLALRYREQFRKDVFVDLSCYRRWGHNELDDPSFTQPLMYREIRARRSVPDRYAEELTKAGAIADAELKQCVAEHTKELQQQLSQADSFIPEANHLTKQWAGFIQAPDCVEVWDTGVDANLLKQIGIASVRTPGSMHVHSHLQKTHIDARLKKIEQGNALDWAAAEAMAIGSLLAENIPCRISGQDVGRGTFSNRHVMLVDQTTDQLYIPLNAMDVDKQAYLEVANSILSEEAVLGFEYGMAIESPKRLVIWEAQFGDFFNGAQIILDTFISGGETKWLLQNGLVMLLPHGYDGAGPEHSSCRVERFLQLCDSKETAVDGADVNWEIVHPTTPAQYFHLLRRQIVRNYRKPLVVVAPKILLRLPAATSAFADMSPGTHFWPVLADPSAPQDAAAVTRIVFCSGKHYYALNSHRQANKVQDCAIIRLEALCPFPAAEIRAEVKKFPKAKSFIWSQEESRNSGPWFFIQPRFANLLGIKLRYVGRPVQPIPAVAVGDLHSKQHADVFKDTFQ